MKPRHPRFSPVVAVWLAAGVLCFVPHLFASVVATASRPNFDSNRQLLSELGERGSAGAEAFNFLGVLPTGGLLLIFGLGVMLAYRAEALLRIAGALIVAHGIARIVAAVFSCDASCRPVAPSVSQSVHNMAASGAFITLTIALFLVGAWLVKRRERILSILATYTLGVCAVGAQALLLFGPSGFTGLHQRIALGALQLWVVLFAAHIYTHAREPHQNAV